MRAITQNQKNRLLFKRAFKAQNVVYGTRSVSDIRKVLSGGIDDLKQYIDCLKACS